jgi:nicotinate phosphoribosyltransferase
MSNPDFGISPSIIHGDTADVYFHRTMEVLRLENMNPTVIMEFFANRPGIICGLEEVKVLLHKVLPEENTEVWTLEEGSTIDRKEVVLRIKARYVPLGLYETAICGILASSTGWATAAAEIVEAAGGSPEKGGIPVVSFGARHVHPNVAAIADYAAVRGGCVSCSTNLGAKLAEVSATGTMPHALILIFGDTVRAMQSFDKHMPFEVARIALVDTFKDEAEESLLVARALREKLRGVRLDTASERGGVTPELVREIRARLDLEGFNHVNIWVSGGLNPERIARFRELDSPVTGFGVGSYISGASPNDFTADIHEVDGKPIAKRGRIPGVTRNPRLNRIL